MKPRGLGIVRYECYVFKCFQQNHGLQIDYTESFYVGGLFSFTDISVKKSFISAPSELGFNS